MMFLSRVLRVGLTSQAPGRPPSRGDPAQVPGAAKMQVELKLRCQFDDVASFSRGVRLAPKNGSRCKGNFQAGRAKDVGQADRDIADGGVWPEPGEVRLVSNPVDPKCPGWR